MGEKKASSDVLVEAAQTLKESPAFAIAPASNTLFRFVKFGMSLAIGDNSDVVLL